MGNGESSYRRFLAGDNEGMLEIVCEYQAGLMLYLNSYVQDIHMAEDLAEDTFLELMLKRPKFSGKSSFKTWLFAIGRNITAKHLRKHAKLSVVPLESQEYLAVEDDIEDNYIKTEQKKMVHQAAERVHLRKQCGMRCMPNPRTPMASSELQCSAAQGCKGTASSQRASHKLSGS